MALLLVLPASLAAVARIVFLPLRTRTVARKAPPAATGTPWPLMFTEEMPTASWARPWTRIRALRTVARLRGREIEIVGRPKRSRSTASSVASAGELDACENDQSYTLEPPAGIVAA